MGDLVVEIINEASELCKDSCGNFVIQHMLEYGTPTKQSDLIHRLLPQISMITMHRIGSRVVEKALEHAEAPLLSSMSQAMISAPKPTSLVDVACSRCGSSILIQMLNVDACEHDLRIALSNVSSRLAGSKFGRKVLQSFGLMSSRWHNFDLEDSKGS